MEIKKKFTDSLVGRKVVFEVDSFSFKEFLNLKNERLFYWRTLAKAEVDFIIKDENGKIILIEVKAQKMASSRISRSLRNFINFYKPKQAVVVNMDYVERKKSKIPFCILFPRMPFNGHILHSISWN